MLQAQVPCKGWWKPWDVLGEPRLWGHPLLLPSAAPQSPGGRGEAVEPQNLNARYKLLFQSKHLLPSLVKIVPMPSLCFLNLYLITFSLSPVCLAALRKHTETNSCVTNQGTAAPHDILGTAEKPLSTAGSHGMAFPLAGVLIHQSHICDSQAVTGRQEDAI